MLHFFVDIDGTVADNSHREGFLQGTKKDWEAFYNPALILQDKVVPGVDKPLTKLMENPDMKVTFLTGRPERTRDVTHEWFARNLDLVLYRDEIIMRKDDDHRAATRYKEEMIRMYTSPTSRMVFIDDDIRNVGIYSKYGLFLKAPECWAVIL